MANITTNKDVNAEFERYAEKTILSELILTDNYVIDLYLLKDIFLGTLLSLIKTREEYNHIFTAIPEYAKRSFNDITKCFPELAHFKQDVMSTLFTEDTEKHDKIFVMSPVTLFVRTLQKQIMVNANHSAVAGKRDAITFTINTYPLYLSSKMKHVIGLMLSHEYGVNVVVDRIDPNTVTLDYFQNKEEIYTFHIKELLANKDINTALSRGVFINKKIFAASIYGYDYMDVNIDRENKIISSSLALLTEFTLIPAKRFIPFIKT